MVLRTFLHDDDDDESLTILATHNMADYSSKTASVAVSKSFVDLHWAGGWHILPRKASIEDLISTWCACPSCECGGVSNTEHEQAVDVTHFPISTLYRRPGFIHSFCILYHTVDAHEMPQHFGWCDPNFYWQRILCDNLFQGLSLRVSVLGEPQYAKEFGRSTSGWFRDTFRESEEGCLDRGQKSDNQAFASSLIDSRNEPR
jgi:hypothetical protein